MMTPANVGHLESVKKVWIIPTNVQEKVKVMDMLSEQHEWITMFREDQVLHRAMVIIVSLMARYMEDMELYRTRVLQVVVDN